MNILKVILQSVIFFPWWLWKEEVEVKITKNWRGLLAGKNAKSQLSRLKRAEVHFAMILNWFVKIVGIMLIWTEAECSQFLDDLSLKTFFSGKLNL